MKQPYQQLVTSISSLLEPARQKVVSTVNTNLVYTRLFYTKYPKSETVSHQLGFATILQTVSAISHKLKLPSEKVLKEELKKLLS